MTEQFAGFWNGLFGIVLNCCPRLEEVSTIPDRLFSTSLRFIVVATFSPARKEPKSNPTSLLFIAVLKCLLVARLAVE